MIEHNIISVSGGKDSTALLLLAIERQPDNLQAVFADTGHEHPQTYEYVRYLEQATGVPIRWVRADFTKDIERKRQYVLTKWKPKLLAGVPGYWEYTGPAHDDCGSVQADEPAMPDDPFKAVFLNEIWRWRPTKRPLTEAEADEVIARAAEALKPTGIPYLDLCIWKGRFPSSQAAFCSEQLKRDPIIEQMQLPLLEAGDDVISWQGVRADESRRRALLAENECKNVMPNGAELWNYRPILKWTAADCFAMHKKHGIEPNPLYKQGMTRVGCMPCINCRKDELLEISKRFPEEIDRAAEWERRVSLASKRQESSFFPAPDDGRGDLMGRNIYAVVEWSKTSRGGRQFDWLRMENDGLLCSSLYGLCE